MKPILVVDDRSQFPTPDEDLTDLVEFHTRFRDRSAIDFGDYATIFVHGRNDAQQWAVDSLDDKNEVVFVFSGGEDRISEYAGVYTLPRPVFTNRFASFLRRYAVNQDVQESAEVFTVEQSGQEKTTSLSLPDRDVETVRSDATMGVVEFYLPEQDKPQEEGMQFFPIERRDRDTARSIDFVETLKPLQEFDAPYLIHLREKYLSEGDGLDLLLHLRLEAEQAYSRYPVAIDLQRSVEAWVRQHPRHLIAATDGVAVRHPGRPDWPDEDPGALSVEAHKQVLERLPLSGKGLSGRHDLANEWGPIRLWSGLSKLSGTQERMPDWVYENARHLQRRRYYKYLFALLTLRQATEEATIENHQGRQPREKFAQWQHFLDDRAEPLRVLLIDDEVEEGWGNAFQELFQQVPDQGSVEAPFTESDFENNLKAVRREAVSPKWDLVLADLRLTEADQRTASRNADQLTGMRLIRWIKEERPDLPIVAVTASNKAWTSKSLSAAGADGYWVKENPQYGVNLEYTVNNAADLLETIHSAVTPHDEARPIWQLVEQVEDLLNDRKAVDQWVPLTKHQKPEEARKRLQSVVQRLRRAYGYLVIKFTDHEETQFSFQPFDLAFLTVWSILNEVVALHYKDPPYEGNGLHETEDRLYFSFFDPAEGHDRVYWVVENGSVEKEPLELPSHLEGALRPKRKGHPVWPRSDTHRVSWLLRRLGRGDMDRRFNELRRLRNKLEEEHGEVTDVKHADLTDVCDMVQIWDQLLSK